jgi:tRNA(fMet)-specific endonuclease VapC
MAYLVDADWIINAAKQRRGAIESLKELADAGLYVSIVALAEVFEGAHRTPNPQAYIESYKSVLDLFEIINLNEDIMSAFAETRALLRRQGTIIPDFDILIGVTAVHYDLTLLTFNIRHLNRIPGIRIYQHP